MDNETIQKTVDEIVLKNHESHIFEDPTEVDQLMFFVDAVGQVICARKVFSASLPRMYTAAPHDKAALERDVWTAVELLKVIIN